MNRNSYRILVVKLAVKKQLENPSLDERDSFNGTQRNITGGRGMDSTGSTFEPVAGNCEHGN